MTTPKICSIEGCGKPATKRGWCDTHYARFRRTGSPVGSTKKPLVSSFKCEIEGCGNSVRTGGLCTAHYKRNIRHGDPLAGRTSNGASREWLLRHVNYDGDDCLKWPFGGTEAGYGVVAATGGGQTGAHREMCRQVHGEPPHKDSQARHLCGKGHEGCVNPKHLVWGSQRDNSDDMVEHGTVMLGEVVPSSVLTRDQVREIRKLRGRVTQSVLAKRYGVVQATISFAQSGRNWYWLE